VQAFAATLASRARQLLHARRYHLALASLTCGLACAEVAIDMRAVAAAVFLALATSLRRAPVGLLCALLFLSGALAGSARLQAIEGPGSHVHPGRTLAARAHLLERPRPTRFGSRAEVRLISGAGRGARLLARTGAGSDWPKGLGVGAEIVVHGRVRRPRRPRGVEFDFGAYLRRRGVSGELWLTRVTATGRRRGGLNGAIDRMRVRAERALGAGVSTQSAALLRGMVLGQDELVDDQTRDDWRASGLAHLLAVSGQNVMLLAALALPLLAATRLPVSLRAGAMVALIALYVPLAGAGPSLQRAGVMGVASLVALGMARPSSRWYVLLLAACVTLAVNPRAHGDPGWQLSFAAVAGILLLGPRLRDGLSTVLPRMLAEGVAITVAATVATAPLLAYTFGSLPLLGLPANVLALPLVAPIMWLGMIRVALGQLAAVPIGWAAQAAGIANDLAGVLLEPLAEALAALARAFADLPAAQVGVPPFHAALVACAYATVACSTFAGIRLVRSLEPRLQAVAATWRRRPRAQRIAVLSAGGAIVALLLVPFVLPPPAPTRLTVSFLDVGQGDATLIQHPDGTAVLFDGGPPEGRAARLLRRAGVRRLSAVVMTHASRDHHGGLREVVERYPVDLLLDGGDGTRDRDFRAIASEAVRRGARRVLVVAPSVVRVGGIEIRILSPARRPPGPPPEDPNLRATVAVVSVGHFDLLLSADAESPTLSTLRLPQVEAMKVPHHGSADPGLPEVLRRLRPSVASVPVGQNTYGHPARSTLAVLRAAGARVYRNDRDGTVRLTVHDGGMYVSAAANP
jgi:competence protein ComEC